MNVVYYTPSDEKYLEIIKDILPEYYDKAMENYLKKKEAKK